MKVWSKIFILILVCALFSSCATITTGRYQKVSVNTLPDGAVVTCEGQAITAPGTLTLLRNQNHTVLIQKEGYYDETVYLKKTLSGATAGNLILGGIIGAGIDATSGAMYKLVPEEIHIELKPKTE